MKITIFSFGDGLGQAVTNVALAHGEQVTIYVPDKQSIWPRKNLTVMEGSLEDRERVLEALLEADVVISVLLPAGGIRKTEDRTPLADGNARILSAMEQLGKVRFVTVGHVCIHAFGDSDTSMLRFYSRMLHMFWPDVYRDMQKMGQVLTRSRLNWTLVRGYLSGTRAGAEKYGISLDGSSCRRGITQEQLAEFLYEAASDQSKYSRKMPVIYKC